MNNDRSTGFINIFFSLFFSFSSWASEKRKKKKKVEITYQIYIERYCDHFHMIYLIKIKFRINKVSLKDSEKEERETKKLLRRWLTNTDL